MPDERISELDAIAALEDVDEFVIIDKSDLSMAPTGTTKKGAVAAVRASLLAAHTGAADPHADRAFATAAIGTHVAAADPHGDRAAAVAAIAAAVANLVNTAPGTLDTLNELAVALANDPNFATTMTNLIATKQPGDANLTALAAIAATAYGRSLLALATGQALADEPALKAALNARYAPLAGGCLLTAVQTILTGGGAVADITWDVKVSDPDGWATVGAANVTVPAGKAGRYAISYHSSWSASTVSGLVGVYLNGTCIEERAAPAGAFSSPTVWNAAVQTVIRTLAAGDTIKVNAGQFSGANRDVTARLEICPV